MFSALPGAPFFVAVIALLPAVSCWWASRALLRDLDHPLLPERLLALQRRTGMLFFVAAGVILAAGRPAAAWGLPLLLVSRILAPYRLRQALYGETWSIGRYLALSLRAIAALGGFWIVLATLPLTARTAGRWDWLLGGVIGAALLLWNARHTRLVLWLLGARPLRDESLVARMTPLAGACGVPHVRFAVSDQRGGATLNALALPAIKDPAVLFTDALLARLDPDEVVAIGAHELAHLEFHSPQRLRRGTILIWILVALAMAVSPLGRATGVPAGAADLGWLLAVACVLVALTQQRQKQETESDRRATELTGDPDALIRALTKAYTFNRFPRRLDGEFERQATHPSLAKRIRDIRASAAREVARLEHALTVTSDDGTVLTLEPDRLHWTDPRGLTRGVPYRELTELRMQEASRQDHRLVARGRNGEWWTFRVVPADASRLQHALDIVDLQLAEPPPRDEWIGFGRLLTTIGILIAVVLGSLATALILLAASLRPRRYLLAAAGVAVLLGGLVLLRDGNAEAPVFIGVAMFPLSIAMLALAWKRTPGALRAADKALLAAMGTGAALVSAGLLVNGTGALDMFLAARSMGAGCVLPGAFVAALAVAVPRLGAVAVPGLIWACAVIIAGTSWAVDTFCRDPLLVEAPAFEPVTADARPFAEFTTAFGTGDIRLSPGGTRLALAEYLAEGGEDGSLAFHVGAPGGTLARVAADDLAFVDEDRFLVLRPGREGVELQEVEASPGLPVRWRLVLPDVEHPYKLTVHGASRHWMLHGTSADDEIVRLQGRIGAGGFSRTTWRSQRESYPLAVAPSGADALVVEYAYEPAPFTSGGLAAFWPLVQLYLGTPGRVHWWRVTAEGDRSMHRSRLPAQCGAALDREDRVVCSVFDGARTRLASIDPATGTVDGIGSITGEFVHGGQQRERWLAGFVDSAAVVLDLSNRKALRLASGSRALGPHAVAATDGVIAAVWYRHDGSTVRVYRIPG